MTHRRVATGGWDGTGGAFFRLYCLIRVDTWKDWGAEKMHRPYFAAGKGNCCGDVAWRQAARAELAQAYNRKAGLVALDLVKCYAYVQHNLLAAKWKHMGLTCGDSECQ